MATFVEKTQPYEVLIRFTDGQMTGAHFQTITTVLRDGVLFGIPVINQPEQLALVTGESGDLLSDVLGENLNSLVSTNQLQASKIEQLSAEIEALRNELSIFTSSVQAVETATE